MAIILVTAVCMISEYFGQKEIIFPEVAALVISAWALSDSESSGRSAHFWLSPSIAALTGVVLVHFLNLPMPIMVMAAFVLVLIQLKLMDSAVFPSFSAAVLPILIHTSSMLYPLSVCLFTALLALGKALIDGKPQSHEDEETQSPPRSILFTKDEFTYWLGILVCITAVAELASVFHASYLIAPPLIVAFVEMTKPSEERPQRSFCMAYLSVTVAAFSGAFWLWLIHNTLGAPMWVAAAISVTSVYLIFHFTKFVFPPSAAIALLPLIIPSGSLFLYPLQVAIGCAVFMLVSLYWPAQLKLPAAET